MSFIWAVASFTAVVILVVVASKMKERKLIMGCPVCGRNATTNEIHNPTLTYGCGYSGQVGKKVNTPCEVDKYYTVAKKTWATPSSILDKLFAQNKELLDKQDLAWQVQQRITFLEDMKSQLITGVPPHEIETSNEWESSILTALSGMLLDAVPIPSAVQEKTPEKAISYQDAEKGLAILEALMSFPRLRKFLKVHICLTSNHRMKWYRNPDFKVIKEFGKSPREDADYEMFGHRECTVWIDIYDEHNPTTHQYKDDGTWYQKVDGQNFPMSAVVYAVERFSERWPKAEISIHTDHTNITKEELLA